MSTCADCSAPLPDEIIAGPVAYCSDACWRRAGGSPEARPDPASMLQVYRASGPREFYVGRYIDPEVSWSERIAAAKVVDPCPLRAAARALRNARIRRGDWDGRTRLDSLRHADQDGTVSPT